MIKKCISVFIWSTRYSCQILMKLEFFQQIFEKYSNIKFLGQPPSGSRVVPSGQTPPSLATTTNTANRFVPLVTKTSYSSTSLATMTNGTIRLCPLFVPLVTKTSYSSTSLATMTNRTIRLGPSQQWQATQTNTSRNLAKMDGPLRRQRTANPSHCTSLTQVIYVVKAITSWPNFTDFWLGYIHDGLRTVQCITHRQGTPRHTTGPSRSPNRP